MLGILLLFSIFGLSACQVFPDIPAVRTTSNPGALSGDDQDPDPSEEEEPSFTAPRVENLTPADLSSNLQIFLAGGIDPRAASGRVARIKIDILRREINNARVIRVRRHGPFENTVDFTNAIEDLPKFNCDEPLASLAINGLEPVQVINDFEVSDSDTRLQLPNTNNLDGDRDLDGINDLGENPLQSDRQYVYTFCLGHRDPTSNTLVWDYRNLSVLYTLDTYPSAIKQNPQNLTERFLYAPTITSNGCEDEEDKRSQFNFSFQHELRDSSVGPYDGIAAAGSSDVGIELRYFTTDEGDTSVLFNTLNENGPFGALNTNGIGSVVKVNITKARADEVLNDLRTGNPVNFSFETRSVQSNPSNTGEISFAGQPIETSNFRIGVEFVIKDRAHDPAAIVRDFPSPANVLFSTPFGNLQFFGRIPPPFLPSGRAIRAYLPSVPRCVVP